MEQNNSQLQQTCKRKHHRGGGPTSFDLHDANLFFSVLNLQEKEVLVDLGCGRGDYSLHAAQLVGPSGRVYALDNWPTYGDNLVSRASKNGINNITAYTTDISTKLPLQDEVASCCLLGTVLHAMGLAVLQKGLIKEMNRVLQPGGRVAILEMKKEEQSFGPPLEQRLSAQQVEKAFFGSNFSRLSYTDLGLTYLLIMKKCQGHRGV